MNRILILAFSDLHHDARIRRQIEFLKTNHTITLVCFDAPVDTAEEIIRIKRIRPGLWQKLTASIFLLVHAFEWAYEILYGYPALRHSLASRSFNLIIANDIECLRLAVKLKKKEKILFDAHEYAPRHFEDKWVWRVFFQKFNEYLCRVYIREADAMTTVSAGLAMEYQRNFNVNPVIITNAAHFADLKPGLTKPGAIRLIHQGAANPSRQLELMIDLLHLLDERFTLDLMLLTPAIANQKTRAYVDKLKARAADNPRVKIIDAVASDKVIETIQTYDVGIFLLPPVNFNYANTLPNKFFEFVQARLAVAIGPTPEMAELVKKYDLGVVSEDFSPTSLAQKLNELTVSDVQRFKEHSDKAAKKLSAEINGETLRALAYSLLRN
jgi:hypothetical protein